MNFAAYQWRADKGYLPAPGSMAQPLCQGYPGYSGPPPPYWAFAQPQPAYAPPSYGFPGFFPGMIQQPPAYHPGPVVPIEPPKQKSPALDVASTPAPRPPVPSVKKSEFKIKVEKTLSTLPSVAPGESSSGKKSQAPPLKQASTKLAPPPAGAADDDKTVLTHMPCAPPSLRPGTNYLFPASHTRMHIFSKASKIWEEKYKTQSLTFKMFKIPTTETVDRVISRILKGGKAEGWAMTEVFEVGEGGWRKGSTVEYGSEKGKGSLEGMGWGFKRGRELEPVWVVVHKV